jgi:hypothetical protein
MQENRTDLRAVVFALLGAMLMACGGGGGADGGSVSSAASEGPISGFGSVIMNGVRWNTDDASFEMNGQPASQSDLSVGMVVRIEGRRSGNGLATADHVIFESRLRGPIRQIDELGPDARALHVFGVRALVSLAGTVFDGVELEGLGVDTIVDVSGLTNGDGDLEVTHLRLRGVPIVGLTEVKHFGRVVGLSGGSFMLSTSEVLFDDDTVADDFEPAGLRDGVEVRVEGILLANDAIDATEIESPRGRGDDDFDEIEIQGITSDFVTLSDFRVAGRQIDASGAALIPDDPDLLKDGVRVEVEGRFDADGVLIAEKLKFRSNRVRIHAEVANDADVDAENGLVWLLGIPVQLDSNTRIRDKRDDDEGFALIEVTAGDFLEIRGIAGSDGVVTATQLEREDRHDIRLRGPVDRIDADLLEFTILGVRIPTSSRTFFEDGEGAILTRSEFFARVAPGTVVEAKDREDGDETEFDLADEVEIEEPELEDDDDSGDDPFEDSDG